MFEWLCDRIHSSTQVKSESVPELIPDNLQPLRPKSIDEYRQKFLTAPLGSWHQAVGTFGVICDEKWEFQLDRTGKVSSSSAFSGDREMLFEWREVTELTIACRVTKWPEDPDAEDLGVDGAESEEWQTIRYDFKTIPTDVGEIIGMYQISFNGTINEGFWHSLEPLSFSRDL